MERLTKIGFRGVGEWKITSGEAIAPCIVELMNEKNMLYAFISGDTVLYVGQTTGPLKKRMDQYKNAHKDTQTTNFKNKQRIFKLLSDGKQIEIYAFPDSGLHYMDNFHLNLAAGLEQSIINLIPREFPTREGGGESREPPCCP